jgi:hypothetical protein
LHGRSEVRPASSPAYRKWRRRCAWRTECIVAHSPASECRVTGASGRKYLDDVALCHLRECSRHIPRLACSDRRHRESDAASFARGWSVCLSQVFHG